MSNNTPNNRDNDEIDLGMISQKMSGFLQSGKDFIFDIIQFVIKNIILVSILFFAGLGLGIYQDLTQKVYDNQLVVTPNFFTADYLYSKIALIDAKIKERDTVYLKKLGFPNPSKIKEIKIKPIIDVYQFITNANERNFDLLRLMSEDSDIKKIIEEGPTAKNYTYHEILFATKNKTNTEEVIKPLLAFLNNSAYYSKIQKESVNNLKIRIRENDLILTQINNFLNGVGSGAGKSEKLVYYNENSPLNELIRTKEELIKTQGYLRVNLVSSDKIIKEVSQTLNMENRQAVNGKMKIILPLLFVGLFVALKLFADFYKTQSLKRKQTA